MLLLDLKYKHLILILLLVLFIYIFVIDYDYDIITHSNIFSFHKNEMLQKNLTILFTPSLDSKLPNPFFPKHPRNYIDCGVQVPFLLGFNDSEGSLFVGNIFGCRYYIYHYFTKYILNNA